MPPPPSQAGKFKPRKPAVRRSAERPNEATPIEIPSTTGRPSGRTLDGPPRGGRGDGRGRADGRGRGRRAPVPMGQAFFTGSSPSTATGRTGVRAPSGQAVSVGSARIQTGANKSLTTAQEEVVGLLDEAVGARPSKVSSSAAALANENKSDYMASGPESATQGVSDLTCFYDSDNSQDESISVKQRATATTSSSAFARSTYRRSDPVYMPPLTLPLPERPGLAGRPDRQAYYTNKAQIAPASPQSTLSSSLNQSSMTPTLPSVPSPFVNMHAHPDIWKHENQAWCLVQLPTRLPPLVHSKTDQMQVDSTQTGETSATAVNVNAEAEDGVARLPDHAEVVVKPLDPTSFDHVLADAPPGRVGRLLVYKSGKTVLVWEGPEPSESGAKRHSLQMNVSEGLTCNFHQEAVVINTDESEFVSLGQVDKTIVVTPDLDKAFFGK
jgi:RNA polymerase III RPC4